MARIVHIVPVRDEANGVWRLANLLASEDGGTVQIGCRGIRDADEIWVHGLWLPREWRACWNTLRQGKRLVRMTHGSLSPVYLAHQGKWKKRLVGPIERFFLRRADRLVATCEVEKGWIQAYLGKRCPKVEIKDIKRFFDLNHGKKEPRNTPDTWNRGKLNLLYLGRRHPLKGLEYLEEAVKGVDGTRLQIVSSAFGEEKEKVWDWCDVLVLPTLSENFGLVVAEALERGKRVIATDGAPAWGDDCSRTERVEDGEIGFGYGDRLFYLKGYRDGSKDVRVKLLRQAIDRLHHRDE